MRELNKINMDGTVVIGEGEWMKPYVIHWRKHVNGSIDIAVDPLEGTKFTANGEPNAFSVLAVSEKGVFFTQTHTWKKLSLVQIYQEFNGFRLWNRKT